MSPARPVILLPAVADTGEVAVSDVDVRKLDSPTAFFWPKGKDEHGIDVLVGPIDGSPGLNDHPFRLDVQDGAGEAPLEGTERRTGTRLDRDGTTREGPMDRRIQVHIEQRSGVDGSDAAMSKFFGINSSHRMRIAVFCAWSGQSMHIRPVLRNLTDTTPWNRIRQRGEVISSQEPIQAFGS